MNKQFRGGIIYLVIVLVIMYFIMSITSFGKNSSSYGYSDFLNDFQSGNVTKVEISQNAEVPTGTVKVTFTGDSGRSSERFNVTNVNDVTSLVAAEGNIKLVVNDVVRESIFVTTILPFLLIAAAMIMVTLIINRQAAGGGGAANSKMMNFGKSRARMTDPNSPNRVTFKDVAGLAEEKEELEEIVDFLKYPKKYVEIGARIPKGVILTGPPGTGKTLLAKAVAGEAGVPFFSLSGSDFVEMFVGVGASRVRDLFKQAQQSAPCIIFIDEIDAIGKSRDSRYGGGNDEREQTLNQLLAEMDGFDPSKGVFILAATNRPDVLDKALLRPGRFDRRIIVDKPDLKGRVNILKVHSKDVLMDDTVDLEAIALATAGAVGSDLANMINEAAINAVKNGRGVVSQKDLFESVEVVIAGKEKKDRLLSPQEKKIVSYHEVGHALVTALSKNAEPVQKITIVPRTMGSLGYTMQVPEEEKYLMSKEELMTRVYTLLGGRAAEEIVFNSVTTGASNDIERATKLVRNMITLYGMSDRFGLMGLETVENQYLDGRTVLNCSDRTAAEVDDEVKVVLKDAYGKVKEMLAQNREVLDKVADFLIEKETITGKEFMEIFNEVKGIKPDETGQSGAEPDSTEQSGTEAGQPEQSIAEVISTDADTEKADGNIN